MATINPYTISRDMYKEQRQRLSDTLKATTGADDTVAVLLKGASDVPRNYSDTNFFFRQDSYLEYLFGYEVQDCYAAILPGSATSILFVSRMPEAYAVFMGPQPSLDFIKGAAGVDEVHYVDEINKVFTDKGIKTIHVLSGINADSGHPMNTASFEGDSAFTIEKDTIYEMLSNQRVIKTQKEIELLTWINGVSSRAHIDVMQKCKPQMSQHQLEAMFSFHCFFHGGMRQMSYSCICATGNSCAVLHYPDNDKTILDGQMALLDMGGEYHNYASDITCSFPVNGKFSDNQRIIYSAVLDAQMQVFRALKPGAKWLDMHMLALRVMAGHLLKNGFFTAEATVDIIMEKHIMRLFQPHGLGHLMGMEVHDVGGYPKGGSVRPTSPDGKCLRTTRAMEKGICITVEPGMYFNQVLLTAAFADSDISKYLNEAKLREFWEFGGVRIEDDVIITEDGILNLTCCPRTIEEIEATMAGAPFTKAPEVISN